MYARETPERTVTLAVSGKLWNRSLVMVDEETGSLWSHLLGRAMSGEMKGVDLKTLPGLMTDWDTWRELHPQTTVVTLSRTTDNYRREFYQKPARFVIGLTWNDTSRAWPFDQLLRQTVVNDVLDDLPLVVVFDPKSKTAFLFDRRVGGKSIDFEQRDGKLVDMRSGRAWDPRSGRELAEGDAAVNLKPVPGIVSYRHIWELFYPRTTMFSAP